MSFVAPTIAGERVALSPATAADADDLAHLDWQRSQHPAMGGWMSRPVGVAATGTAILRRVDAVAGDPPVGAIDAVGLPGYPGVVNVSIYTDTARAPGGLALEGYGLYVDSLFAQGARVVHHEVIALNSPIKRLLRAIRLEPTARLRDHAYAAGRWWDVLVYSYDRARWEDMLARVPRNPVRRDRSGESGQAGDPAHDA